MEERNASRVEYEPRPYKVVFDTPYSIGSFQGFATAEEQRLAVQCLQRDSYFSNITTTYQA